MPTMMVNGREVTITDEEAAALAASQATTVVRMVPRRLVVERLAAAGKLRTFRQAVKAGDADGTVTDAELALRERWASGEIASNDTEIRAKMTDVGADPNVMLA